MVARTVTTLKLDPGDIRRFITGPGGPVYQAVQQAAATTRDRAKVELIRAGLVDKGLLVNSIETQIRVRGDNVVGRIGTDVTYARYVHEGTDSPIVPRTQRALAFVPRGGARLVVVSQVRGTKETGRYTPYLTIALEQLSVGDLT